MRWLAFFAITLLLIGCNPKKSEDQVNVPKPDSLLPEYRMILILTDLHMTESALAYLRNQGKENKEITRQYYNLLFSRYKITRERFNQNLKYYQSDEENFIKMYDKVTERINKLSNPEKKKAAKSKEVKKPAPVKSVEEE
jgi:hypothetical protein